MLAPDLLAQSDPEVWDAIRRENQRQEEHVELIASENYVSRAVLIAQGSQLTNKYAEGYPGRRYYGGCEFVDIAESLAIERAKKLFGAPWANVQPHSGSQANQAVYTAALKPGDTILGMSLAHGGHLTRGSPVNLSGKLYRIVSYGLNAGEEIDYDAAEAIALAEKPKLVVTGASAYSLAIDWKRFRGIADKCGALLMADIAHYAGLIAAGLCPSPIGIADFVTTTNHKTLRGPRGGSVRQVGTREGHQFRHFSRPAGRAAHARGRGEGRCARRGPQAGLQVLPEARDGERARHGGRAHETRRAHRLRPHRIASFPRRPALEGHHGPRCRSRAWPRAHYGQQERDSERPGEAHGHERHPHRHAGDDDARLWHGRGR